MLSKKTIEIVKATVPVLEVHGVTITETFYRTMLTRNPELKNYFNQSNQKAGKQPLALAQTVLAAAKNIDQLHVLAPAIQHILHKHRSLHITPELYTIVGENLLLAIAEVLGEAATDDIMNAWKEAYFAIADVFISLENELVRETLQNGGWEGYEAVVVTKIVEECDNVKSFYLENRSKKPFPVHIAGQYISVLVDVPSLSYKQPRQYSLSMLPNTEYYRISVKQEDSGTVSGLLHNNWKIGDVLHISAPAGNFIYEKKENTPVVFFAGGIGVTPLLSMLNQAQFDNRPIHFVQCVQNSKHHAFKEEITKIANNHSNITFTTAYSTPLQDDACDVTGFITKEWIQTNIDSNSDVYVCGPTVFMSHIVDSCHELGFNKSQVKFEVFGPFVGLNK